MKHTQQQKEILDTPLDDKEKNIVLIPALAGSGKTTTLVEKVKIHPDLKFCYLSFNKSIKEEINNIIDREEITNLTALTMHGLAYKNVLPMFGFPPILNLNVDNIQRLFPGDYSLKTWMIYKVILLFNRYCGQVLSFKEYKKSVYKMTDKELSYLGFTPTNLGLFSQCFDYVERLYNSILSKKSGFITHNFYLKYFIDNLESFNFGEYGVFLFDEAQDLNEPMAVFVKEIIKKEIPIILVGDYHQSIYGFIKSINVMNLIEEALPDRIVKKQLTKSFRFPSNSYIENKCNIILNSRDEKIEGVAEHENIEEYNTKAYLSRTNRKVFEKCLSLIEEEDNYELIGGIDSFDLKLISDIYNLIVFNKQGIKNKYIKSFNNIDELVKTIEENKDIELASNLAIASICKTNDKTPERMFSIIRQNTDTDSPNKVGTVHKTKGLGFDYVCILDHSSDLFIGLDVEEETTKTIDGEIYGVFSLKDRSNVYEEINILYVGMSRAKKFLEIRCEEYKNTLTLLDNINNGEIEVLETNNSIVRGKKEKWVKILDNFIMHQRDFDFYVNKIKGVKLKNENNS